MTTLFRVGSLSLAIAALTACGGGSDGSIFNNQNLKSSSIFSGKSSSSSSSNSNTTNNTSDTTDTTDTDTTDTNTDTDTPAKPNQDSSTYTTSDALPTGGNISENKDKVFVKSYDTKNTRGNLHSELESAYGKKFNTTFTYTTKFTNNATKADAGTYLTRESILLSTLGNGYGDYTMDESIETNIDGVKYTGDRKSRVQLYQQENSIVLGKQTLSGKLADSTGKTTDIKESNIRIDQLKGKPFYVATDEDIKALQEIINTAPKKIADAEKERDEATNDSDRQAAVDKIEEIKAERDEAKAKLPIYQESQRIYAGIDTNSSSKAPLIFNYKGKAFNQTKTGDLEYSINFNTQAGHGKITGLDTTINLNEGNIGTISHTNPDIEPIKMLGIQGVANFDDKRADGTYTLGIFGDYATEIAGFVTEDNVNTVGFGGTKQ